MNTQTSKPSTNSNRQPRRERRGENDSTVMKLRAELETLKKGQSGLQTAAEIKHLKGRVTSLEKTNLEQRVEVMHLADGLRKLGVPAPVIDKLRTGQPVVVEDFGSEGTGKFATLLTPKQ